MRTIKENRVRFYIINILACTELLDEKFIRIKETEPEKENHRK